MTVEWRRAIAFQRSQPFVRKIKRRRLLCFLECATSLQDSIRWTILVILLIRASNLRGALNIRRITNLEKVSVIFFFLSLISIVNNHVKVLRNLLLIKAISLKDTYFNLSRETTCLFVCLVFKKKKNKFYKLRMKVYSLNK